MRGLALLLAVSLGAVVIQSPAPNRPAHPRVAPPPAPAATAGHSQHGRTNLRHADGLAPIVPQPASAVLPLRFRSIVDTTVPDTAPEPVIIELQIGRLARATVAAYRVRSEVLIPLSQLFQLVEIRYRVSSDGRVEATMDPGNRSIVIDARTDTMQFGERRVHIEPEFRYFDGAEVYIGAERLGDLFGLMFAVNWAELTVTVVDPRDLPIARRVAREGAREAYLRRAEGVRADVTLGLERPQWDGVVVDYSVFSPSPDPLAGAAYTMGLGADLAGGSLEVLTQSVGPAGAGRAHTNASWTGVWRERRWVKQVRLGDGSSTGPRGRALLGFSVTNAPFVRPSLVGALRYDGRLEPGWSVEAYRGGDLVAYDSADAAGRFAINLPVRYGENPVDFVAYGPFGEIRHFNRTYRVLLDILPPRRFEYGLSAGQCRGGGAQCRATANVDMRYGVTRGWTVQGGLDQFWRDTAPDRLHPYAGVVANPTNSWALEGELVGRGLAHGGVRYEPSVDFRLEGDYTRFTRDSFSIFAPLGRRAQWGVGGFLRPSPAKGYFFFDARVDRVMSATGSSTRTRLGASAQTAEIRFLPYVRTQHDPGTSRAFAGLNTFVVPRPGLGAFFNVLLIRTATELERRAGLVSWSAFAARPISRGVRVEVGATWERTMPGAPGGITYSLTLTSYFAAARAITALLAPPGGPVAGTQFVQGSVLWDRQAGRLGVAPGPSLERSGLSGRVFLDENGNGVRDIGEPGIAGVRVLVGANAVRSDSDGAYRVWDLVPFEPILVSVDSLSLESPLLVPLFARASIVPGPNRFRSLDIPVVQAGVIEGRVVREGRGVGGVTLLLTERRSGARQTLVTFTDGAFYLLGVKPGDYELAVQAQVLDALAVDADPLRFTLAPTPNGVGRSDLEIRLRPRF